MYQHGTVLTATPQMLQSLGRVARAPGIRAPVGGQLVAIPLASGNGAASGAKSGPVQLPSMPVVLSTPQRLNQQQQQQQSKNFISPILDNSGSRKRQDIDRDHSTERLVAFLALRVQFNY